MIIREEIFWFEVDQILQNRLVDRITYDKMEALQRNEELLWIRDRVKELFFEKAKQ